MTQRTDMMFTKSVFTLQQICSKQQEFPIVVLTRDKIASFPEVPVEEEGKFLLIEKEWEERFARIKVLPFHDEGKGMSEIGAELFHIHSTYIGEEFYIPLSCPGSLKVVPYPSRRQRYTSVKKIMEDNPRYLKSNTDVKTITSLKGVSVENGMKRIVSGSIIETKVIIHSNKSKYLKCVDRNGNSYILPENCRVDFLSLTDQREYTLEELCETGILLPTPVQFNPEAISRHDVALFGDEMVTKALVIASGPLEFIEVISRTMLVAITKQAEGRFSKKVLMPSSMYKQVRVQQEDFRSSGEKSKYIEMNFDRCHGVNEDIKNTMYLLPVEDKCVCWLRSLKQLRSCVQSFDSTDSGVFTEEPETKPDVPPRLPASRSMLFKQYRVLEEQLNEMHTVELMPTLKVKDESTVQRMKLKAKLGFGHVHEELKRLVKRKNKLQSSANKVEPNSSNPLNEDSKESDGRNAEIGINRKTKLQSNADKADSNFSNQLPGDSIVSDERNVEFNESNSMQAESMSYDLTTEAPQTHAQSRIRIRPLPALPAERKRSLSASGKMSKLALDYAEVEIEQSKVEQTPTEFQVCNQLKPKTPQTYRRIPINKCLQKSFSVGADADTQACAMQSSAKNKPLPLIPRGRENTSTSSSVKQTTSREFTIDKPTHQSQPTETDMKRTFKTLPAEISLSFYPEMDTYSIRTPTKNRPPPSLPHGLTSTSTQESLYVDMAATNRRDVLQKQPKVTARINPLLNDDNKAILHENISITETTTELSDPKQNQPKSEEVYSSVVAHALFDGNVNVNVVNNLNTRTSSSANAGQNDGEQTVSTFFDYSVRETVECLRFCGLKELADICEDQELDGEFFRGTDESTLSELFGLTKLNFVKLKRIYGGWRPKR